jgi:hypothetical protein
VNADQRAAIIRDLDKYARDAASYGAFMSRKFRDLMESEDPGMLAADAVAADGALMDAMRALPELRRIFAKRARLLDGPPPQLEMRATDDPARHLIVARTPAGDLDVGHAVRDDASWRVRLTDTDGSVRAGIGGYYQAGDEDLLEAATRHMDENGPWWSAPGGTAAAGDEAIGRG